MAYANICGICRAEQIYMPEFSFDLNTIGNSLTKYVFVRIRYFSLKFLEETLLVRVQVYFCWKLWFVFVHIHPNTEEPVVRKNYSRFQRVCIPSFHNSGINYTVFSRNHPNYTVYYLVMIEKILVPIETQLGTLQTSIANAAVN